MTIEDFWGNPLSPGATTVIGYRGEITEFPHDLYSYLLSTVRKADQDEVALIWRWLQPMQQHWETQYAKILSVFNLLSPENCPTEYLDYLRKQVGILDDLSYLWTPLSELEKRKLIKYFVRFLMFRNTSFGISEELLTMTGVYFEIRDFFYYRWIISGDLDYEMETALGREDDGYDPWLISEINLPVAVQPNYVYVTIIQSKGVVQYYYVFHITNLVSQLTELPVPRYVSIRCLATGVSTRAQVFYDAGLYYCVADLDFLFGQSSSSLSDVVSDFLVGFEPDPYVSDILIEDDGTLNREVVVALARFNRPASERIYIRYYLLLERFIFFELWTVTSGTATHTDNLVTLYNASNESSIRFDRDDAIEWYDYCLTVKSNFNTAEKYCYFRFMYQDSNNYYYFRIIADTVPDIPVGTWKLGRVKNGFDTSLDTGEFDQLDISVDYVWRFECFWSLRGISTEVQYIRVYQDENLLVELADDPVPWSPIPKGTIELAVQAGCQMEVSRVDVHSLPMEYDYIAP
jgi:hypothetical protein